MTAIEPGAGATIGFFGGGQLGRMTALAARQSSAGVPVFSFSLKMGMKAAVSAPSPRRRRKRLGIWKASVKAPATMPAPMNQA